MGSSSGKRLADLTQSSMQEMGVNPTHMDNNNGGQKSVRKKRPMLSQPSVVLEEDGHRPEYITVTMNTKQDNAKNMEMPKESRVAKTVRAIRRTESKVTCFGVLDGHTERCGRFINQGKKQASQAVPAPCFWGHRSQIP